MTTTEPPEMDVHALGPLKVIGSGGQGKVFQRLDEPDGPVYKEYSPRVVDDLDVDALRKFVLFAHTLEEPRRAELLARTAWPEVIVRRDGVVRGFLMRRVPTEFVVPMSFGREVTNELARVQFLLNPREYLLARSLDIDMRFRMEFLHDTAAALALFHDLGISVGDLSPNNLVFSPFIRPRCFFIDCDAMRLGGEGVLDQVETPDWQVGDEELATPETDVYKFGLLAIRLFAGDQQLRNPHVVPSVLRPLVVRSLSESASRRPSATRWVRQFESNVNATLRTRSRRQRPVNPRPAVIRPVEPAATRTRGSFRAAGFGLVAVVTSVVFGILGGTSSNTPTRVTPYTPTFRYTPTAYVNPYTYRPPIVPPYTYRLPTLVPLPTLRPIPPAKP